METNLLRRYTSLPNLLYILNQKCITLSDPENWDDHNDSYFIRLYKKKFGFKSILALCFAESDESYHHWKIYSGNPSGVCIEFAKDKLLKQINGKRIRGEYVEYKLIPELRKFSKVITIVNIRKLPFIKRKAFEEEREFRLIYESEQDISSVNVPIEIGCISRIIFNPWILKPVYYSVRAVIKKIDGCKEIKIVRTTLTDNEKWKTIGEDMLHDYQSDRGRKRDTSAGMLPDRN